MKACSEAAQMDADARLAIEDPAGVLFSAVED
jgi:hypothetical protein